ncbi:hypothetical protein STEG23_000840, partial [Scotinomys teguina]
ILTVAKNYIKTVSKEQQINYDIAVLGSKKPTHVPGTDPDPTACGAPNQFKLNNCLSYPEDLVQYHGDSTAIGPQFMSFH